MIVFLDKTKVDLNDPLRRLNAFVVNTKGVTKCHSPGVRETVSSHKRVRAAVPSITKDKK